MDATFGGPVAAASVATSDAHDKKGKKSGHHKAKRVVDEARIAKEVGVNATVKHAFGSCPIMKNGIQSFSSLIGEKESSDRVVFRVGRQLCIYNSEGQQQQFLQSVPHGTVDVLSYCISSNNRYIAISESLRLDKDDDGHAQVSIYSATSLQRLKTLTHPSSGEFISVTFCGDVKYVATLTSEPDNQIIVFQWEKEKLYKTFTLPGRAYQICSSPSSHLMLTVSGPGLLKSVYTGPDGNLKLNNLLISSKEMDTNFLHHCWLPHNANSGMHKVVTLTDVGGTVTTASASAPSSALPQSGSSALMGSTSTVDTMNKKQVLHIFEGAEGSAQVSSSGNVPIVLDLRQTITIRVDPVDTTFKNGLRLNCLCPSNKGFVILGSRGYVAFYERTDDVREPYQEFKILQIGDEEDLVGGTIVPSEEKMVLLSKNSRVLTSCLVNSGANESSMINAESEAKSSSQMALANAASVGSRNTIPEGSVFSPQTGGNSTSTVTDFTPGGFHLTPIASSSMATERSILLTIGGAAPVYNPAAAGVTPSTALSNINPGGIHDNRVLRLWNFESMKCELAYYFGNNEPLAVAVHHNGFQVLVSFKDRVRLYNVLLDKLKQYKEVIQKLCKELKFCNGGQFWAGASTINVVIYDTASFQQLMTFQGHMLTVRSLCWEAGDQMIFSAGLDGNVYGWRSNSDSRIEIVPASNRSPNIIHMAVESVSPLFPTSTDYDEGNGNSIMGSSNNAPTNRVVTCMVDGTLRVTQYQYQSQASHGHNKASEIQVLESNVIQPLASDCTVANASTAATHGSNTVAPDKVTLFTALCISLDRKRLFAGTSVGSVRIYPWPLPNKLVTDVGKDGNTTTRTELDNTVYVEVMVHSSAVLALYETPSGNTIISTSEDGSIFLHTLATNGEVAPTATDTSGYDFDTGMDEAIYNNSLVMTTIEDVDEQVQQVVELQKKLEEAHIKSSFEAHQRETAHVEELRNVNETHDYAMKLEKERYDDIFNNFTKRVKELQGTINNLETEQIKVTRELENRYEHKLADQLDRYDTVCEEMETLRQKCEGVLASEREEFTKAINDAKYESAGKEKQSTQVIKRLVDDKNGEKVAFKEILEQQEDEYEDELRLLVTAAESELSTERDNINKLRTLLQSKNTKLDQMKKKLQELSLASKARLALLQTERKEKVRLQETIEHYKRNLLEREEALAEKEKVILELRNTTRTLENFRIVLDHRLQQLSAERGPITSHIEHLEQHIATMYEELVEEFDVKKASNVENDQKDQKISMISSEIVKLRGDVKQKEAFIAAFRRELGIVIGSSLKGKDLDESVKMLYKKYVLHETSGKVVKSSAAAQKKAKDLLNSTGEEYDSDEEDGDGNNGGGDGNRGGNSSRGGGSRGNSRSVGKGILKEVEDELVEAAKESERQKLFVERQCSDYLHRLNRTRTEALRLTKSRLNENSTLMYECNDLRREVRELQRKLELSMMQADKAERELKVANRALIEAQGNANINSSKKFGNGYSKDALQEIASASYDDGDANRSLNMNNIYETYSQKVHGTGAGALSGGDSGVLSANPDNKIPPINPSKLKKGKGKSINSTSALPSANIMGASGRLLVNSKSAAGLDQQMAMTDGFLENNRAAKQLNTYKTNKNYLGVGNKSLANRTAERLTNEIEMLVVQLDNSERENIMQGRELNRLKNIIRKLGGEGQANDKMDRSGSAGMLLGQRDAIRDGKAIVPSDTVVSPAKSSNNKNKK